MGIIYCVGKNNEYRRAYITHTHPYSNWKLAIENGSSNICDVPMTAFRFISGSRSTKHILVRRTGIVNNMARGQSSV